MPQPAPPEVQRLAREHRRRQQRIAAHAVKETRRLWRFNDWPSVARLALSIVRQSLTDAARGSQLYVASAVRGWGEQPKPYGTVAEHVFGDSASDGRPLDTLLAVPDHAVRQLVDQGATLQQARAQGERQLERIVATQVADASRISTGVAAANDRQINGYIRHLTLPSCNRCIILAGRWYRWSDGFKRHPNCDCVHIPAAVSAEPPSAREIYDSLSDEERRKAGWSGDDQRAIDDGADLAQVTNVRRQLRSMTVAGRPVKTTGVRFRGQRAQVRLVPEQIYAEADRLGWTREQTLDQLRRHGFIL